VNVTVIKQDDQLIVKVVGRIDTVSAPDFQRKMEDLICQGVRQIVVDLENLEYISSAGLRCVLVAAQKTRQEGGTLCCCGLQGVVRKVFEISGFKTIIPIFDSAEQAAECTR
jgi:anti-anti-sigma factor